MSLFGVYSKAESGQIPFIVGLLCKIAGTSSHFSLNNGKFVGNCKSWMAGKWIDGFFQALCLVTACLQNNSNCLLQFPFSVKLCTLQHRNVLYIFYLQDFTMLSAGIREKFLLSGLDFIFFFHQPVRLATVWQGKPCLMHFIWLHDVWEHYWCPFSSGT